MGAAAAIFPSGTAYAHYTDLRVESTCGTYKFTADFFGGGSSGTPRTAKVYEDNVLVQTTNFTGKIDVAGFYMKSGSLPVSLTVRVDLYDGAAIVDTDEVSLVKNDNCPTNTPTNTPVPPSATPTKTLVPPTPTNTMIVPTATPTTLIVILPTVTVVPPTSVPPTNVPSTSTSVATATKAPPTLIATTTATRTATPAVTATMPPAPAVPTPKPPYGIGCTGAYNLGSARVSGPRCSPHSVLDRALVRKDQKLVNSTSGDTCFHRIQ